ncbi:MAG: T9SS type A sorting domain-containing protein [Bacteroidales bacterium]|nr:T9SS type A sorting domain-containing protein [Bacteroidales bacterium]
MKKILLLITSVIFICSGLQSQNVLFWGDFALGLIVRSDINGDNINTLCTGQIGVCRVRTDDINKKVYWAASLDNKIRRVNYDGTELEDVISTEHQVNVVEVHPDNNRIYFSENNQNTIKTCKTDGSALQTIINDAGLVMGIGIDPLRDLIFWADMDAHKLHKANLDGSGDTVILETPYNVFDICLDIKFLYVYFTERTTEKVWRVSYDGTNLSEVHQGSNVVGALAINDLCEQLYWIERENGLIVTGTTSGTGREEVIYWENSQISGIDVGTLNFSNSDFIYNAEISIYPNPCSEYVFVELNGMEADRIEIYDIVGKNILASKIISENQKIDISHILKGIYLVRIMDKGNIIYTEKIIKKD